jgi:hypothetical protein
VTAKRRIGEFDGFVGLQRAYEDDRVPKNLNPMQTYCEIADRRSMSLRALADISASAFPSQIRSTRAFQ